jgi:cytochrome c553
MPSKSLRLAILLAAIATQHSFLYGQNLNGDAARGKIRSKVELCQECHGEAGLGTARHYPKLGGQWAAYIRKQLNDFQSGARKHEIMSVMVESLSQQDIADIAAYFSGSPHWPGEGANFDARGQTLFANGDKARDLPACSGCHGGKGGGADDARTPAPAIGGQREAYLASQLYSWKAGERHNSLGNAMNGIALKLRDDEIEALARYISGSRVME